MKIIPAIDIIDSKTVRLEQGSYSRKLSYDISPADSAKKWRDAGAEFIHIVDLDGARLGKPVNLHIAEEIAREVSIPIEIGGGYREEKDIESALSKGIYRVIVGSKALKDMVFAERVIKRFKEHVIISVDSDGLDIKIHGWETTADLKLDAVLSRLESFGAGEIIYTDVSKDGTLSGPSIKFLETMMKNTKLKFIYAGGVKNIEHVKELKKLENYGLSGVIVGRALYDGTLDIKEALKYAR
ncbi:1-(5-phosphoribosyl)-5-[(5-phosphoribosylamino)methylideneamino] imidazole-4-carboxamide isomerase [Candidatus Omnitrophus magneticus]|uniref:1-(5-phosphoribosyl)-5-[(5-phosphoribosylamino)methylideneamino] imidazole-4-carboxamide isomerase n=1 Tax=Candidatus Omnitrophus magneticus TaxID=1609969 RepID=A0A0F0CTB4_9BACT|nr:1-(5-phosphoribosyl)-5-[(5-phosphoribosylamino)methylideneamino] imidazole-4-carboxamide isomerase [Candidatus Omnitrophus magneticus]